jgi:hypothetical protein
MWKEFITNKGKAYIKVLPNECPFCHKAISPNIVFGYKKENYKMDVFLSCPDKDCNKSFIGEYNGNIGSEIYDFSGKVTKGEIRIKDFSKIINEISPSFVTIYNQAFYAEQERLFEICGVGYRKALEFLIKDYAIIKNESEKTKIESKPLGSCINDYVTDNRIKLVSKRAVWLGNDETHYVRKWEGKNLDDLKNLFELTIHWVEMEKLTESFKDEMPE